MKQALHNLKHSIQVLLCLCFFAFDATTVFAQDQTSNAMPPIVTATRLSGDNAKTRFVAELTYAVSYNVYVIPDPYRVIVDLPQAGFGLPGSNGSRGRGLVSGYRFGRINDNRSRIVLDATGPVLIDKSFILHPRDGQPARLIVDLIRTDPETFAGYHRKEQPQPPPAPAAPFSARTQTAELPAGDDVPLDLPPVSASYSDAAIAGETPGLQPVVPRDQIASLLAARPVPIPRPRPDLVAARKKPVPPAVKPPLKRANGKRIIVLDPGHGGIDPGAVSRNRKIKEKAIVLRFARRLKEKLSASSRYKVIMTRRTDRFLTLRERVKIARDVKADLFIAIHADSIRGRSARGATVYTVSDKASDKEAAELAQQENRSDIIAGVDLGEENNEITGILIDLAQRETKNYSISAAKKIAHYMKPVTKLNSRPLRSAGFRVLMAPDVPSVLLELGYISNKTDRQLLTSKAWRKKVTAALARAVDSYFATRLASGN